MRKKFIFFAFFVAFFFNLGTLFAEEEKNDPLGVKGLPSVWLQGEPVKEFQKDTLYILEFWATWCGPCIKAMPHLEELHQHFKGNKNFRIIGINVMDRVPSNRLMKFLKSKGLKVNYTIAAESRKGKETTKNWLEPRQIRGIPKVFAYKNGKILWDGHPNQLTEKLINTLLSKDPQAALSLASSTEDKIKKISAEISASANRQEFRKVHSLFQSLHGIKGLEYKQLSSTFRRSFYKYIRQENYDQALELTESVARLFHKNFTFLALCGSAAIHTEQLPKKKPEFSLICANEMLKMEPQGLNALSLKAEALFLLGDVKQAVQIQEKVVQLTAIRKRIEKLKNMGK